VEHIEVEVEAILKKDGVLDNNFADVNQQVVNAYELIKQNASKTSWSRRLVDTESNSATMIGQMPGEGNRRHYHPGWNEWWFILAGKWEFEIDGEAREIVTGDVVFIEKGKVHKITAIGDQMAIRLAVSRNDVEHIYPTSSS
jgi:quercetin dioxygenase-like cupin family protein